jgi:Fe2+ transport system protein B
MKEEMIESIFGCLERIEEKLDKQPVQNEQGESENNRNLAEALSPLVDSMNRTNRNLCVLRDGLKIISDRQKKDKGELMVTVKQEVQTFANKNNGALSDEVHNLKRDVLEQLSKPQHKKVTHDLTTNTWWLMGIGIVLFFLIFFLTVQIYDQSKEIDRLELSDWKYRALRATLPSNNVNVVWLERNVWRGNDKGIRQCQQFVINYEDSIRRRYQMEQEAAMRDSIGRLMIRQSQDSKKKLK